MGHTPNTGRLAGWKEIAAYFSRDDRTVMRWEKDRGLPVHRVPGSGKASVYAYPEELERWLATAGRDVDGPGSDAASPAGARIDAASVAPGGGHRAHQARDAASAPATPPGHGVAPARRVVPVAVVLAAIIVVIAGSILYGRQSVAAPTALRVHAHAASPEAEELYLKGLYYWNKRTPDDLQRAADLFVQSIVRDPKFAPAYAGLADSYNLLREFTVMPPESAYPRAKVAAERAIALDDQLAPAHRSLAFVDFYWSWDVPAAQHEFDRALALDPLSATTHHWYANYLMQLGRLPEALAQINKAQELEPTSKSILADKGLILCVSGAESDGVKLLKEIELSDPDFLSPHSYLGYYYIWHGDLANAIVEMRQSAALTHNAALRDLADAGDTGFRSGGNTGALQAMLALQRHRFVAGSGQSAFELAETEALVGQDSTALAHLQLAYESHDPMMVSLRSNEQLRSLRRTPQFRQLLANMGLPPRD